MKLFVDSGIVKEIEALASLGIIDGATTNPSLMAKAGGDPRQILKEICRIVQGPVSGEVVATDYDGMIREGHDIAAIDEHMVVKVPFTRDGVKACKTLSGEGIPVNVTLIFSATQALLAAKVGASFVSPFIGRLDDIATDGMHLDRGDRRDLRQLRVRHRGAGRQRPAPRPHRPGRAAGRRRVHVPAGRDRADVQASAHGHRAREVPEGLGEGAGGYPIVPLPIAD